MLQTSKLTKKVMLDSMLVRRLCLTVEVEFEAAGILLYGATSILVICYENSSSDSVKQVDHLLLSGVLSLTVV